MKKNLWLSFYAILGISSLVSCSKTNNSPSTTNTQSITQSMSAKIDGTSWVGTTFSGINSSGTLVIEGAKSDGSQFTLDLPISSVGSHPAGNMNPCQATYQSGTTYSTLYPGTITISSNSNNVISGTFSGTFTNSTTSVTSTVTNGVFTVKYQ